MADKKLENGEKMSLGVLSEYIYNALGSLGFEESMGTLENIVVMLKERRNISIEVNSHHLRDAIWQLATSDRIIFDTKNVADNHSFD